MGMPSALALAMMSKQFGRGTVLKEVRMPEAVMTDFCYTIPDGVGRTWPEALPNGRVAMLAVASRVWFDEDVAVARASALDARGRTRAGLLNGSV